MTQPKPIEMHASVPIHQNPGKPSKAVCILTSEVSEGTTGRSRYVCWVLECCVEPRNIAQANNDEHTPAKASPLDTMSAMAFSAFWILSVFSCLSCRRGMTVCSTAPRGCPATLGCTSTLRDLIKPALTKASVSWKSCSVSSECMLAHRTMV